MSTPSICFVGLENLPVLAPEYRHHALGGAQLQQTLLAKGLAARGWRVSMVVADYGQADGAAWDGVRTYRAYRFDAGLPLVRFFYPRWTSLWSAMRRANADIYYVSCASMQLGEAGLFARRHRRKVVFRIAHDSDCQPDRLLIRYWRDKRLYVYGLRNTALILAQSETQRTLMHNNFARDSLVIPSLAGTATQIKPWGERTIDALWISNIRQFKRPDLALELARHEPRMVLHMIGGTQPGSEQYYQTIQQQAAQLPNVVFHGHLPMAAVNEQLAQARVLINTSDSEGFPNTYMQAWARGTPVIGLFDPDGIVARERLGYAARSVVEMRAACSRLLANEPLWAEISTRCQSYVNLRHGKLALDAYESALKTLSTVAA